MRVTNNKIMEIITSKNKRRVKLKEFFTVAEVREIMLEKEPIKQQDHALKILIEELDGEKDKEKIKEMIEKMDIRDYMEIVDKATVIIQDISPKKK